MPQTKGDHDDEQSQAAGEPQNETPRPQIGQIATEKPWLNSEGYHDPTAYEALRGVERWERSGRVARVA